MSEGRILKCGALIRASEDGKPAGQDKSREVRAGWGMVFLKDYSPRLRGVRAPDSLQTSLKTRRDGLWRTSRGL